MGGETEVGERRRGRPEHDLTHLNRVKRSSQEHAADKCMDGGMTAVLADYGAFMHVLEVETTAIQMAVAL